MAKAYIGRVYIGTSGWQYSHWKGSFYPLDLPQKEWLSYYAKYFDTVEVNATFYHQMRSETFAKWREITGPNFTFSIKGSRFITHIKRLKDCQEAVERFFEAANGLGCGWVVSGESGCEGESGEKKNLSPSRNVVLWQLPPRMKAEPERLKSFLKILPKSFRQAFEFRDKSWLAPSIYSILKDGNCALVIQDSPFWPKAEIVTSDFVYLRFHGRESLYASCYSDAELDEWAEKMKQWLKKNLDVYGYFNNDAMEYAVENAKSLKGKIEDTKV